MSENGTPYDEADFWAADDIANPSPPRRDEGAVASTAGNDDETVVISRSADEAIAETRILDDSIFVDDTPSAARRTAAADAGPAFVDRVFAEGIDLAPVVAQGFQNTPFSDSVFSSGIVLSPVPEPPAPPRPWYRRAAFWVVAVLLMLLLLFALVWANQPGKEAEPVPSPSAEPTEIIEESPAPEESAPQESPAPEETPAPEEVSPPGEGDGEWSWPWEDWTWPWEDEWTWPWDGDWTWPWQREGWAWPWESWSLPRPEGEGSETPPETSVEPDDPAGSEPEAEPRKAAAATTEPDEGGDE